MAYGMQYVPQTNEPKVLTPEEQQFEQAVSVMMAAKKESRLHYTVHVNRLHDGSYFTSDWYDGTTVASYYDGRVLSTAGNGEMLNDTEAVQRA
jgi:hypothetical protein